MSPRRRFPGSRGFTLVELMVVVMIGGTILLLVPANMSRFGSRSRLDSAGNTLLSTLGSP